MEKLLPRPKSRILRRPFTLPPLPQRPDPGRLAVIELQLGHGEVHHVGDVAPEGAALEILIEDLGACAPKKPSTAGTRAFQSSPES